MLAVINIYYNQIFCLDGDGAALMHMGNMSTIGQEQCRNFKHIIINNGCHDSVGGQPTFAGSDKFSFLDIAKACGYVEVSDYHYFKNLTTTFMSFYQYILNPYTLIDLISSVKQPIPGQRRNKVYYVKSILC